LEAFTARIEAIRGNRSRPFLPDRIELVISFADRIVRDPRFRDMPAIRAFAFWTRKSAIETLHINFLKNLPDCVVPVGRGIAFHLPPANVDTIFLYSWVIAFLTGNVNVTRLPSMLGPLTDCALGILVDLLAEGGFTDVFVSYPASEAINRTVSSVSDLRLVWGGDAKARIFAALPLRLDGRALVFPDRYSYSVVDGAHLAALDPESNEALARRLFNDVFIFSQMACSSPHVLHVVGTPQSHGDAVRRLLAEVDRIARRGGGTVDPAHGIEKFAVATQLAAEGIVITVERFSTELTAARLAEPGLVSVGGGFLGVCYLSALDDLIDRIEDRDQTLSYEGFPRKMMEAFASSAAPRGLRRIVPIGQSLNFDTVWDGNDLLRDTVRFVRLL
jgi:hypothetical protein